MRREQKTVEAMIGIYCRQNHHGPTDGLCADCRQLLGYALLRLRHCPFQEGKTTCGKCPVHCYKPDRREQIREVMRLAGPRMLAHHPLLALGHLLDGLRKKPKGRKKK